MSSLFVRQLAVAALLIAGGFARVDAQRVVGRVVEEPSGQRISFVELALVAEDGTIVRSTTSDSAGYFVLNSAVGSFRIRAGRIGYSAYLSDVPIDLKADETVSVTVRMAVQWIPLEPLVVHARGEERGRDGFDRRRALGKGVFLTLDSIRDRKPYVTSDLFDGISGVLVFDAGRRSSVFPLTGAKCFMIYRDNMAIPMEPGTAPDPRMALGMPSRQSRLGFGGFGVVSRPRPVYQGIDMNELSVSWIRGIEIYRDMTEVPEEIRKSRKMFDMWPSGGILSGGIQQIMPCGVVWIWTELGW